MPQLPIPLAQQFIRDRYRRILDYKSWSGSRGEGQFILNAQKTAGSVTVVRNTTTVTGSGTSFASTDVGRQFKVGAGSPVYSIVAVDPIGQTLTSDMPIGVESGSGLAYFIFDGYVTPPNDYLSFLVVTNPLQAWKLRTWITQDELTSWDPQRTFFGQPYAIVDRLYAPSGVPQFEAWPYTQSDTTLYFVYYKRCPDLIQDTDTPIWPIRSDVIVAGALADVCRWPGTSDAPNPYFASPRYWQSYESTFDSMMVDLERRDEEINMTWLNNRPWAQFPFAPLAASWIQSHAV